MAYVYSCRCMLNFSLPFALVVGCGCPAFAQHADCKHAQGIAMVPRGNLFFVGCSDGDLFAFEAKASE